jgi:hypothetical protein
LRRLSQIGFDGWNKPAVRRGAEKNKPRIPLIYAKGSNQSTRYGENNQANRRVNMTDHQYINIEPARELTELERDILNRLLSVDFEGVDTLRIQASTVKVTEACNSCPSIVFRLEDGPGRAGVRRRVPVEAEGMDSDGVIIHILLHVVKGCISELEIFKEDGSRIRQSPMPQKLNLLTLD